MAGVEESQLRGHGLAHDDSAGVPQPFDDRCVRIGLPAGKDRRPALGRHASGVDDILETDGNAVQGAHGVSGAPDPVHLCSLLESLLRIKVSPGLDRPVGLLDPGKASLDQIDRADQPLPDVAGGFLCRQRCGIDPHGT
jgi:hypothetical protein